MSATLVWSERVEPGGGSLKDCAYSSALIALVFGGFRTFPLGIWTVAERQALERSDDQPDETGASLADLVVAVKRRYGIDWAISRVALLAQHRARKDLAFIITGANGNLPAGHALRRWQPAFTGGHAVCIVPVGDGASVRWFDPLAPNKYAGDLTNWGTVTRWMGSAPSFIAVREDAYAPPIPAPETGDTVNSYPVPTVPSVAMIPAGTWLYATNALEPNAANIQVDPARELPYLGAPSSTTRIVEYVNAAGVHSGKAMFVKAPDLGAIRELPGTATDCTPAIEAALRPVADALLDANAALAQAPAAERERIAVAVGAAEADRIRNI